MYEQVEDMHDKRKPSYLGGIIAALMIVLLAYAGCYLLGEGKPGNMWSF
jgi:hypothetical protein